MAKPASTKSARYRMETRAFVSIWYNHSKQNAPDQWKRFVIDCYDRFEGDSKNPAAIKEAKLAVDGNRKVVADAKYEFLSEKCYTKASGLKGKLEKKLGLIVQLPQGYLERPGSKGNGPPSIEEIASMFGFPQS